MARGTDRGWQLFYVQGGDHTHVEGGGTGNCEGDGGGDGSGDSDDERSGRWSTLSWGQAPRGR